MSATVLYGFTWVGDTQPTTGVLPGQHWYTPTAGIEYIRNSTNTTWNQLYTSDQTNGGLVAQSGSTVTGPLINVPNVAPIANPDFTGTALLNGFPLALQQDLATIQQQINATIAAQVRSQFLSNFAGSPVAQNIAFSVTTQSALVSAVSTGSQTFPMTLAQAKAANSSFVGITIPYPVFASDGLTATAAQLLGVSWSYTQTPYHVGGGGGDYLWNIATLSDYPMILGIYWASGGGPSSGATITLQTLAMAAR